LRGNVLKSPVVKRSVVIAGHKTAVSLEDEFWNSLKEIASSLPVAKTECEPNGVAR
jgi:predicted DNA-binding ribbon-helix-helix protein